MKKMYVGNLPFTATTESVTQLFAKHGQVASVSLITDRDTGRPRGFGFVEMEDAAAAAAIAALDGFAFEGRNISVSEARERPRR